LRLGLGLAFALASACALNGGWVAQHSAASQLPPLAVRRPLASLRLLFRHRGWFVGFVVGLGGWGLYVAALVFAPLSLVQATSAGGIGVLALFAQRASKVPLVRHEWVAVSVSIAGLALLGASLQGGSSASHTAAWLPVLGGLGCSAVAAAIAAGPGASLLVAGSGLGLAAGVLYGAGDVATKAAVGGGVWLILIPAVLAAHGLAFACLQLGFQRGGALATAGTSTLLTNALPIAGGIAVFHERVPGGGHGALRLAAFALVVAGAAVLARGDGPEPGSVLLTDGSIRRV
jgi:hypothetical protein